MKYILEVFLPIMFMIVISCLVAIFFIKLLKLTPEQKLERFTASYDLCMLQEHTEEFCIGYAKEMVD